VPIDVSVPSILECLILRVRDFLADQITQPAFARWPSYAEHGQLRTSEPAPLRSSGVDVLPSELHRVFPF